MIESAQDLARKYRSGELSPPVVIEDCLQRIDNLNPQLHAFTRVFHREARAAAEQAAADFAGGRDLGLLQGVPIAIKDLATTREAPSGAGTTFLQAYLGPVDALLVALLRAQGAVIIGKTTLTEGAFSVHHPDVPAPVNPWAPDYWTGVSSSGSGVAVAAGMAPLALGSDTGGSIRFPSACNHLVGHKPTFGAVSVEGCFPLAPSLDHMGPMARCVDDCEQMYRVIAQVKAEVRPSPLKRRLGVDFAGMEQLCEPPVRELMSRVIDDYRQLGFEIVDTPLPPEQSQLAGGWLQTTAAETARVHAPYRERHAADYGPVFSMVLELGEQMTAESLAPIEAARERFTRALEGLLDDLDALLCPVMPRPTPSHEEMAASGGDPEEIARSLAYTAPFDYSGHPALTLPAGFIGGVPAGYQLVGRRGDDLTLFDLGREHESRRQWSAEQPDAVSTTG